MDDLIPLLLFLSPLHPGFFLLSFICRMYFYRKRKILDQFTCGIILSQTIHLCNIPDGIAMCTTSKAVISGVDLHAGMLIIMEWAASHPVSADLQTIVFGHLSGCQVFLYFLKNRQNHALLSEKMVLTSGRAFVIINLRDLSKTKARPFLSVMNVLAFCRDIYFSNGSSLTRNRILFIFRIIRPPSFHP